MIDSNDHLGINAMPKDRIKIRQIMECAPLNIEDHAFAHVQTTNTGKQAYFEYNYGPNLANINSSNSTVTFRTPPFPLNGTTNSIDGSNSTDKKTSVDYDLKHV